MKSDIGVVILAAGNSSRMGSPKQVLRIKGESLLQRAARAAIRSQASPVVVVLGAYRRQIIRDLDDLPVEIVINPDWKKGMGSSIRSGLSHLLEKAPDLKACIIMAADQPFLTRFLLNNLIQQFRYSNKQIIASEYNNTFGIPVLFERSMFDELIALPDKEGAKRIIIDNRTKMSSLPFPMGSFDIDTKEDFEKLKEEIGQ